MIGLTSLEVYSSFFNITVENTKFEFYTDLVNKFSFTKLKDELEEILNLSGNTLKHPQHEKIGPRIIHAFEKLGSEKSSTDGYLIILMGYARSTFRNFERFSRIVVGLEGDDIYLILKQNISFFITFELSPAIYNIKDISEAVHTKGDHEGTIQSEYDDVGLKTKLILTRFGLTFGVLRLKEKTF